MKKVIPTSIVPQGGYSYTQEETGHTITTSNFGMLVYKVKLHRQANNLPIPFNFEDIIEAYVCEHTPDNCFEAAPEPAPTAKPLTLASAVRLTKTLIAAGNKRVDQAEANRRAEICSACSDNLQPSGCSGCNQGLMKKAIEFIAKGNKTPHDNKLKSCKYCGCFNAAQIWIPLDALQKTINEDENEALPSHCWKKV